ncbi:radical SAM protein [Oceanithermus profundus]
MSAKPQPYLIKVKNSDGGDPRFFDTLKGRWVVSPSTDEVATFEAALQKARLQHLARHFRNDHLQLILLPTEDCNFRCIYCYEDFQLGRMRPEVQQGIRRLVRKRAPGLKALEIGWFGGEPLTAYDVVLDLTRYFVRTAKEHDVLLLQHMTTNGYLLTPDRFEELHGLGLRNYQVTLDGSEEEHDRKRIGKGGFRTFGVIWNNLEFMKDSRFDYVVTIRVNIDRENLTHMPAFIERLASTFGSDRRFRLHLHKVGRWGGANDASLETIDDEQALLRLYRLARDAGVQLDLDMKPGGKVCYAALPYSFVVRADGRINKCTVALEEAENQVGRILADGSLLLNSERLRPWILDGSLADPVCQTCAIRPLCEGNACPWVRIRDGKRPCPPLRGQVQAYLELQASVAGV